MSKISQPSLNTRKIWLTITHTGILLMESFVISLWFLELIDLQKSFFSVFLLIFSTSGFIFSVQRLFQTIRIKKAIGYVVFLFLVIVISGITLKINLYSGERISILDLFIQPFLNLALSLEDIKPLIHQILFLVIMVRALWLAVQVIDSNTVINSLKAGAILFIFYGLLFQNDLHSAIVLVFLIYLLTTLFTLSSSRVANLAYAKGGQLPVFSKNWLFTLLFASLLTLVIGFFGGWFLGTQASNFIVILFFIFIGIILVIGMVIAAPLIFIINLIINYFSQFITNNQTPQQQEVQVLVNPLTEAVLDNIDNLETLIKAPGYGKMIFIIAIILILLIIILSFLFRKPWRNPNIMNNVESLDSLKEPSRFPRFNLGVSTFGYKQFQKWIIKNKVRKLYFSFLEKCNQLSIPRHEAETPSEFQNRIQITIPEYEDEIRIITNLYNQIRYGLFPESEKDLQAAEAAWRKFNSIKKDQLTNKDLIH